MKKAWKLVLLLAVLLLPLTLSGCLPGLSSYTPEHPAGFFNGIWHGWCAPISLVMELCGSKIHMFAENNTGFGYELGFYMAVISGFGGLALSRHHHHRRHQDD